MKSDVELLERLIKKKLIDNLLSTNIVSVRVLTSPAKRNNTVYEL